MAVIDCYTLLGAWPQAEVDLSLEALAAGMQARQVGRSLVTHATAIFYDAVDGNDQAIKVCSQHEPLTPVAVVNPLHYPDCLDEVSRCLDAGVQVFRLCPKEHGYPFCGTVGPLREVLRRMEGAKLLLADLSGLAAPAISAGLEELLPVPTALTVTGKGLGVALHAAKNSQNVWIEVSRLDAGGSIEAAVKHAGANRVVFGSGQPLRSLGSAVTSVQYADLSDADRTAIFEGNLQRVLGA